MIRPFELHRPTDLPEALSLARDLPDAAVYWGGTELLQVMKLGFARFAHLIDLKRVAALRGIDRLADGSVRIAAGSTHREIERSAVVGDAYPALAELERQVANQRVRNVGSIGGNLCFAEPHSDPATFLLAAGAVLDVSGSDADRELSVDEFVVDALTTALQPGELLRAIRLPAPSPNVALGYRRVAFVERPAASVGCRLVFGGGTIVEARVAVGSIEARPSLAPRAAAALVGAVRADLPDALRGAGELLGDEIDAEDDIAGSADYKRHLAGVLLGRAAVAAWAVADAR